MTELSIPRRNWRVAREAFMALVRDPYAFSPVIDLIHALDGPTVYQTYLRMLRSTEGGLEAYRAVEMSRYLDDPDWLAALPRGSLGAAYRDFMENRRFTNHELRKVAEEGFSDGDMTAPHPVSWMARRATDLHDIWHTLTGYDGDILGESCVVAFSFAQTRSLGYAAVGIGGYFTLKLEDPAAGRRAIREAFVNGFRAHWMMAVDYMDAMARPLAEVRQRLNVIQPQHYRKAQDARYRPLDNPSPGRALA